VLDGEIEDDVLDLSPAARCGESLGVVQEKLTD
jgi:hypothetical protein